jgi:hypothetical protein
MQKTWCSEIGVSSLWKFRTLSCLKCLPRSSVYLLLLSHTHQLLFLDLALSGSRTLHLLLQVVCLRQLRYHPHRHHFHLYPFFPRFPCPYHCLGQASVPLASPYLPLFSAFNLLSVFCELLFHLNVCQ